MLARHCALRVDDGAGCDTGNGRGQTPAVTTGRAQASKHARWHCGDANERQQRPSAKGINVAHAAGPHPVAVAASTY
jgi:hypothetical protein